MTKGTGIKRNTVFIKDWGGNRRMEYPIAAAALYPGHLVEINSNGKVQKHSTADGNVVPVKVAVEDAFQGNDLGDGYSSDDPVSVWTPQSGDWFMGILANDEDVSEGDFLESAGDGTLQKWTADTNSIESGGGTTTQEKGLSIVGVARESVDLSDSSANESSGEYGNSYIFVEVR